MTIRSLIASLSLISQLGIIATPPALAEEVVAEAGADAPTPEVVETVPEPEPPAVEEAPAEEAEPELVVEDAAEEEEVVEEKPAMTEESDIETEAELTEEKVATETNEMAEDATASDEMPAEESAVVTEDAMSVDSEQNTVGSDETAEESTDETAENTVAAEEESEPMDVAEEATGVTDESPAEAEAQAEESIEDATEAEVQDADTSDVISEESTTTPTTDGSTDTDTSTETEVATDEEGESISEEITDTASDTAEVSEPQANVSNEATSPEGAPSGQEGTDSSVDTAEEITTDTEEAAASTDAAEATTAEAESSTEESTETNSSGGSARAPTDTTSADADMPSDTVSDSTTVDVTPMSDLSTLSGASEDSVVSGNTTEVTDTAASTEDEASSDAVPTTDTAPVAAPRTSSSSGGGGSSSTAASDAADPEPVSGPVFGGTTGSTPASTTEDTETTEEPGSFVQSVVDFFTSSDDDTTDTSAADTDAFDEIFGTVDAPDVADVATADMRTDDGDGMLTDVETSDFIIADVEETVVGEMDIDDISLTREAASTLVAADNEHIVVSVPADTAITALVAADEVAWDGAFAAPREIDVDALAIDTDVTADPLAVVKVGADTDGLSLQLSQPVTVEIPLSSPPASGVAQIFSSQDGQTWALHSTVQVVDGKAVFTTDHFTYFLVGAVEDNPGWSMAKAEHLARRALLAPTPDDITTLFATGSEEAAVDLLFAEPSAADIAAYQTMLDALGTNVANRDSMEQLYTMRLLHDPYQAKRKLWLVWEDMFSVNPQGGSKDITLTDVDNHHAMLYDGTLGNLRDLVNDQFESYAMTRFLDLLDANQNRPNQNFARELLQLMLMEEYRPLADPETAERNYTEEDVGNLAYILTGYTFDPATREVTYDPARHNTTRLPLPFLGSDRDQPAGIVDYIFDQREMAIAEFVSAKLIRYYLTDDYTQEQLTAVANEFIRNDFEIEITIKNLLVSDFFYSDAVMQDLRYKTPMELVASQQRLLHTGISDTYQPENNALETIGFTPFYPGSIFGRAGMEDNGAWMNAYTTNKWVSQTSRTAFYSDATRATWSPSTLVPWLGDGALGVGKLRADLIDDLEDALYLGRELPTAVQTQIEGFLGADFDPVNPDMGRVRALIGMMLSQPEFVLQSGHDQSLFGVDTGDARSPYADRPKLVLIKLNGGMDYMGLLAPVGDPDYDTFRGTLALEEGEQIPLAPGYALNSVAGGYHELYESGELSFLSGVGLPRHSRSHSFALQQMETGGLLDTGAIAAFFEDRPANATDLVALYSGTPHSYVGAPHLSMGNSSLLFENARQPEAERTQTFGTLSDILSSRNYPSTAGTNWANALRLNDVAETNVANGGRPNPGNRNNEQLPFLLSMLENDLGSVYYLRGDGGYDTHGNQEAGYNSRVGTLADNVRDFYTQAVAAGEELTIVVYSEFGRTNRMNGNSGTDHGTGGGMVVVSNVMELPGLMGRLAPSEDNRNWITPRIDVRSVWGSLLHEHFGADQVELFGIEKTLFDYTNNTAPRTQRLKVRDLAPTSLTLSFRSNDPDFDMSDQGFSNASFRYGLSADSLDSSAELVPVRDRFDISLMGLSEATRYFYELTLVDDQGNTNVIADSVRTARSVPNDGTTPVLPTTPSEDFQIAGVDETVNGTMDIDDIPLTAVDEGDELIDADATGLRVRFAPGTSIDELTSSSSVRWQGGFIAPRAPAVSDFFSSDETVTVGTKTRTTSQMMKLVKVGADTDGISLGLSQAATINIPLDAAPTSGYVDILTSEDGETWTMLTEQMQVSGSTVSFTTEHFTYFLVVDGDAPQVDDSDSEDTGPSTGGGGGSNITTRMPNARTPVVLNELATRTALETDHPISFAAVDGMLHRPVTLMNDRERHQILFTADTQVSSLGATFAGVMSVPRTLDVLEYPAYACRGAVVTAVRTGDREMTDLTLSRQALVSVDIAPYVNGMNYSYDDLASWQLMRWDAVSESFVRLGDGGEIDLVAEYIDLGTTVLTDMYLVNADRLAAGQCDVVEAMPMATSMSDDMMNYEMTTDEMVARPGAVAVPQSVRNTDNLPVIRADATAIALETFGIDTLAMHTLRDVPGDAWYAPAAETAIEHGILMAYAGNRFDPTRALTRAEAVTLAVRASQLPREGADFFFVDLPKWHWAYPAAALVASENLVSGSGYFRPNEPIKKSEFRDLVTRVAQLRDGYDGVLVAFPGRAPVPADPADEPVQVLAVAPRGREDDV